MSFMPTPEARLTAGAYLRKRREAAKLSIAEIAAGCALPINREGFAMLLERVEADDDVLGDVSLERVSGAMRIDPSVYMNLAAGLPAGTTLCRECCCSWNDACTSRSGNCSWAEPDLCSRCAGEGARRKRDASWPGEEPSFVVTASDPHALHLLQILAALRLGQAATARRVLDEAIREDALRSRAKRRPALDREGGHAATQAALDVQLWRSLVPTASEVVHV